MTEKGKGIFAWILSIVGSAIVLFGMKDSNKNTRLHAAQSLTISAFYFIITVILSIVLASMNWRVILSGGYTVVSIIRGIASLIYGIYAIWGIVKVCKDEEAELPILGKVSKAIFGKIIDEEPTAYAKAGGPVGPVEPPVQVNQIPQNQAQPQQPQQVQQPQNTQNPPTTPNA